VSRQAARDPTGQCSLLSSAKEIDVGVTAPTLVTTVPSAARPEVRAGIDWAKDDHAVSVVDDAGRQVHRFAVAHSAAGLRELVRRLRAVGVTEVAIERPDGQVVDRLLETGFTVVVISPKQIKHLRSRYGSAGNKDDRFDAFVLADTLRTDRARLRALVPDTAATVALRAAVRARKDLVIHRVALCNQLRAHLQVFFPAPVGLFHELDGDTSLKFLARFDCQDRADWLSPKRLTGFLKGIRYSGATTGEVMHARITAAPRGASGDLGAATVHVTPGPGRRSARLGGPDRRAVGRDPRAARGPCRRAHLHQPPARRHRARRPAARRDRRRPRTVPHPRGAGLSGRGRSLHPTVRQGHGGRVPVGRGQAAARRGGRVRRRLPTVQPLGPGPLPPSARPRP